MTALLACRAIMDVLGTLVAEGKLGKRKAATRVGNSRAPARAANRTSSR